MIEKEKKGGEGEYHSRIIYIHASRSDRAGYEFLFSTSVEAEYNPPPLEILIRH